MKPLDALTRFATVRLLTEAVNDGLGQAGVGASVNPSPQPVGWDPFEVWRTRVRDARRDTEDPAGA